MIPFFSLKEDPEAIVSDYVSFNGGQMAWQPMTSLDS